MMSMRLCMTMLCLIGLGHPGCGIDVGNAGKPQANNISVSELVALQHDEVIGAALDAEDVEQQSFALQSSEDSQRRADGRAHSLAASGFGLLETGCVENAENGSVTITRNDSDSSSREFGRASERKILNDAITLERSMVIRAPGSAVTCNGNQPDIAWLQIKELQIRTEFEKQRKRTVTLKSTGEDLQVSRLDANGWREQKVEKLESSLQQLNTLRTIRFNTNLTRELNTEILSRSLTTLDKEPLIIANTRNRGTNSRIVKIQSGTVVAQKSGERKTLLRYRDLMLNSGLSCQPISGSVEGFVYADSDATTPLATFTLVFLNEGAIIRYADGREEDLELEVCRF